MNRPSPEGLHAAKVREEEIWEGPAGGSKSMPYTYTPGFWMKPGWGVEPKSGSTIERLYSNDWTRVEDALPELGARVLAWGCERVFAAAWEGRFDGWRSDYSSNLQVTHWMPLPEGPTP